MLRQKMSAVTPLNNKIELYTNRVKNTMLPSKLEHSCFNIFTVQTSNTTSMLRQKMSAVTPLNNKIMP